MPYLRRLPSGKWQATIRGADGKKHTKTDPLKKVVKDWAAEEETKVAQGRWRDPRQAKQTFTDWAARWRDVRVVAEDTNRLDASTLRTHVLPQWGSWRLGDIGALDVKAWVARMQRDGHSAHVIRRAYNLLSTIMRDAVRAGVLPESPCGRHINNRPAVPPKLPVWFSRDQLDRVRRELDRRHRGHSVMAEMMCWVGTRWGEAAAVCGADRHDGNPVDWLRATVRIVGALTQDGRWKPHPKTSTSIREVPIPAHVLAQMSTLLVGRAPESYLYLSPRGRPLSASNWREVWYAAIDRANADRRLDPVPRLDPHDCRHTAASWLAQEGVPLMEIGQLLGHASTGMTGRYAHLHPDAYARVKQAWVVMAHRWRIEPVTIMRRPG